MKLRSVLFTILLGVVLCELPSLTSEKEALAYLADVEEGKETLDPILIKYCVEQSWWKAGEKMIVLAYSKGIDIGTEFKQAVSNHRSNVQKLQNLINKNKEDYTVISPAFQWAQGREDVKMNVKLAHKWDAPATLGCTVTNVKFESTRLFFEAKCPSSKKKFVLNLTLMNRINPEACSWTEAAVGRIVINMKKYEVGQWENIMVKLKHMPKNIHTWWTMKEKLEKEDREYEEAKERERDEQLRAAEELYWKRKKEQEEAEKKAQEEKEEVKEEGGKSEESVPEVAEKVEDKGVETELYSCFIHQNKQSNKLTWRFLQAK